MSTMPRRWAIFSDSVRPVGPERGWLAVARIAARWLAESPRACPGPDCTPDVAARRRSPRRTRATPAAWVGLSSPRLSCS